MLRIFGMLLDFGCSDSRWMMLTPCTAMRSPSLAFVRVCVHSVLRALMRLPRWHDTTHRQRVRGDARVRRDQRAVRVPGRPGLDRDRVQEHARAQGHAAAAHRRRSVPFTLPLHLFALQPLYLFAVVAFCCLRALRCCCAVRCSLGTLRALLSALFRHCWPPR